MALFSNAPPLSAGELWLKAIGSMPPNTQTIGDGHTSAHGQSGDFNLEIQSQAGRMDLFVTAISNDDIPAPSPIEDDRSALEMATRIAAELSNVSGTVSRFGLVLHRIEVAEGAQQAIQVIQGRLPFLQTAQDASEVDFRTTVPRRSRHVPELGLLRVVRWQSGTRAFMAAMPQTGSPMPAFHFQTQNVAGENIDVNTDPQQDVSRYPAGPILSELSDLALEIAEGGYGTL